MSEPSNDPWYYRCKICTTRTQPLGKYNKLSKRDPASVKWFLEQHLTCPTHLARQMRLESTAASSGFVAIQLECPGVCVAPNMPANERVCSLHHYAEEFALWASNIKSKWTSHEYWRDVSGDKWWVRSKNCAGTFLKSKPEETNCAACCTLTHPKKLQRNIVKFALKHHAARLLRERLFSPSDAAREIEEQVNGSTFGRNNAVAWTKFVNMSNLELQVSVRKGFLSIPRKDRNSALKTFMATVVEPICKINASAITSRLQCVAVQYLDALSSNRRDVPWLPRWRQIL